MHPTEQRVAVQLLKLAADAWAHGAVDSAERLTAGAWQIIDGREYIDADHEADRLNGGRGRDTGGTS